MEMSKGEIRRSWETAADKKKQIQILAELNCTDVRTIRDILIEEGIDQRRLPRNRQHAEPEAVSLARIGEGLGESMSESMTAAGAEAEKAAETMAKMREAIRSAGLQNVAPLDDEAGSTPAKACEPELLPGFNKKSRPKVEPRRVHILRRMNELFQAIYATELDDDVPDGDWVEEFNTLWAKYVTEYYGAALANERE